MLNTIRQYTGELQGRPVALPVHQVRDCERHVICCDLVAVLHMLHMLHTQLRLAAAWWSMIKPQSVVLVERYMLQYTLSRPHAEGPHTSAQSPSIEQPHPHTSWQPPCGP